MPRKKRVTSTPTIPVTRRRRTPAEDALPGGKANAKRGELAHEWALKFLETFPITTVLTGDQFDAWAENAVGAVRPPPEDTVAWKGHLLRRSELIKRINSAATHPRMWESNCETYEVVCIRMHLYEVQAIAIQRTAERQFHGILSLLEHYIRDTKHRMQAIKWHELPPQAVGVARHILYSQAWFAESIDGQMNIQRKLANDLQQYQQPLLEEHRRPALPEPIDRQTDMPHCHNSRGG